MIHLKRINLNNTFVLWYGKKLGLFRLNKLGGRGGGDWLIKVEYGLSTDVLDIDVIKAEDIPELFPLL